MAQRKPEEKVTVDQVLKLVDQLSTEEREEVRAKLNSQSKTERWQALSSKVQDQCRDLPSMSDDEIVADLKEIRKGLKGERASQSGT
jgi:hypothetical protein